MCLSIIVDDPSRLLEKGNHCGFEFAITHNGSGYRCGYVKVTPEHPWFGMHYSDLSVGAHGGLTFAEPDIDCDQGGPDNGWWLGFDCAHYNDAPDPELPATDEDKKFQSLMTEVIERHSGRFICNQEYVREHCKSICEQAQQALVTANA